MRSAQSAVCSACHMHKAKGHLFSSHVLETVRRIGWMHLCSVCDNNSESWLSIHPRRGGCVIWLREVCRREILLDVFQTASMRMRSSTMTVVSMICTAHMPGVIALPQSANSAELRRMDNAAGRQQVTGLLAKPLQCCHQPDLSSARSAKACATQAASCPWPHASHCLCSALSSQRILCTCNPARSGCSPQLSAGGCPKPLHAARRCSWLR